MLDSFLKPEWDDAHIKGCAKRVGPDCAAVVGRIFDRAKTLKKYARCEILVLDEWLTEDVADVGISFFFELIECRYAGRSIVLCT